jgi:integrase
VGMGKTATARDAATAEATAPLTVALYLTRWLSHMQGRVRAVTYEGYEALIRRHALPELGAHVLTELRPLDLQELYGGLLAHGQLSAGTILNLHLVLTQAFGQAVRWQLLARNPAAGAQPPRPQRALRVIVDEALLARLLQETAGTVYELPCAFAAATGMRRGEILAARWTDITADRSRLQVVRTLVPTAQGLVFEQPKTARSRRSIVLPEFLRGYLERQEGLQAERRAQASSAWQETDLVVDRGNGDPVNPDSFSAGWGRLLRKRGLPRVRFHDLRHAHATLLLVQGVHPKIVSERLGHASIGITLDTYSHVLPSLQSQAAEAFDALFSTTSD